MRESEFLKLPHCVVSFAGEDVFKLLVHSLCPPIFGHEMVKAGLVLTLFGGTSKYANDKENVSVRGDPHLLMVGDPGLGKSQMLQSCHHVAPRSVFVTATGSSSTGLTVTLVRGQGNEFFLEAGALVLADHGCCCIDEFDKMTNQHSALLGTDFFFFLSFSGSLIFRSQTVCIEVRGKLGCGYSPKNSTLFITFAIL